ncbi:MAG: hypothetical protein GXY67_11435 [Clostridiales bacterium]|nr:hypothetical protein [Clostridiales bacterium]
MIVEMVKEWREYNETHQISGFPKSIFRNPVDDFAYYIDHLDDYNPSEGMVPSTTYFCLDEEKKMLVGAVNIRHHLNDYFLRYVGHVGDGIRPFMMVCPQSLYQPVS